MNHLTTKIDKASVTAFCADAISELERAARLFPTWPKELHFLSECQEDANLKLARHANEFGDATGTTIFAEEYYEFLEATRKAGNIVAARKELVQAMAMLLRISCHLDDYVKHGAMNSTETCKRCGSTMIPYHASDTDHGVVCPDGCTKVVKQ